MLATFLQALRATLYFTLLTGLAYPLVVTGIAQLAFPGKANGSLLTVGDKVVGSGLIGQPFGDPKHFWSRGSGTSPQPYNGSSSSGTNLGPTNPALREAVEGRVKALHDAGSAGAPPVDLVTASGSGLDPHITPAAAEYQVARIAKARGLPEGDVRSLVARFTEGRDLGILGEPRVNVLLLNLALDGARSGS